MPHTPAQSGSERVVVVRVITRLNIGGPSIQATRLTTALEPHGFTTRADSRPARRRRRRHELPARARRRRASTSRTLRRPLSPLDDVRALLRALRRI